MNNPPTQHQPARLALREWMRGRVTSQELAADLNFTPVYISYIRTGKRAISEGFKWRFAVCYGTDAARQVFGNLPDSPAPPSITVHAN